MQIFLYFCAEIMIEMQSDYTIYLQWLRAALWDEEVSGLLPVSGADVTRLIGVCCAQGTGPLVFTRMLAHKEAFPAEAVQQMKMVCAQAMQQQMRLQHTLLTAWKALADAGVRAVLMKGAGLATLYREPYLRAWGDVDLFVGKDQYHDACRIMRETFPEALCPRGELDHCKHYNLIADGVSIEVHYVSAAPEHPCDVQRYYRIECEGMNSARVGHVTIGGVEMAVPETTFNSFYVFLHSWEHMLLRGACLKQFCDMTLLLHYYAGACDRRRLGRYLRRMRLKDVWQVYMYILVNHLGLSQAEAPFYSDSCAARAERMLIDLLEGRMVKPKNEGQAPTNRIARKLFTMRQRMRNVHRMARYSPSFARHMKIGIWLHGASRFFARDRKWE